MVAEKTLRFQSKNWNLDELSNQIMQQLQADGYKTQLKSAPLGTIIQAQKAGILRDIITADRAFTIMISGQPNDFTIHVGIGKGTEHRSGGGGDSSDIGLIPSSRCARDALDDACGEGNYPQDIGHCVETSTATDNPHVRPGICSSPSPFS